MTGVVVRPATAQDIAHFTAKSGLPAVPTVIAWVGEVEAGGEKHLVGIGGFAILNGHFRAFLDLTEEAAPYKMTLMRTGKRMMAEARRMRIRYVYAEPDEAGHPGATRWLESLGFVPDQRSGGSLYRWQS